MLRFRSPSIAVRVAAAHDIDHARVCRADFQSTFRFVLAIAAPQHDEGVDLLADTVRPPEHPRVDEGQVFSALLGVLCETLEGHLGLA